MGVFGGVGGKEKEKRNGESEQDDIATPSPKPTMKHPSSSSLVFFSPARVAKSHFPIHSCPISQGRRGGKNRAVKIQGFSNSPIARPFPSKTPLRPSFLPSPFSRPLLAHCFPCARQVVQLLNVSYVPSSNTMMFVPARRLFFTASLNSLPSPPPSTDAIMPNPRPPRPSLPLVLSSLFISFLALAPVAQVGAVNALQTRAQARTLSWEELEEVFMQGTVEEGEEGGRGGGKEGVIEISSSSRLFLACATMKPDVI